MLFYHRIFFSPGAKNTFRLALFLFLLTLFACGFYKPASVKTDFSTGDMEVSVLRWIDEDDIFSAVALVHVSHHNRFYPVKAALVIKRPSYLRMEFLPVIGVPDFFLSISPEMMKIFIPSKGEFYSGLPTVSNLNKFLPWRMDIEDMIMILTGAYPLLKEEGVAYQMRHEDNLVRVAMKAPSGASQIIWIGENNKLVKLVRQDDAGENLYHVEYTYDNNNFPETIKINFSDETTSLSIQYSDVKIEKHKDLSIFDLAIPDHVSEIILE